MLNFLRQALSARKGIDLSMLELRLSIMEWMERLDMDPSFADRYLNEGFSGGEKKRNEILQMAILEPEIAILDETDSGLDIDALRIVAKGVQEVRTARPELGVLAITHYQRLLDELKPDVVHILVDGRIVETGGPELAKRLESRGLRRMALTTDPTHSTSTPLVKADFPLLVARPCTASRSSTSTRPRPRRSRGRCSTRMRRATTRPSTPTCTAASTPSPRRPPTRWSAARAKVRRFISARSAAEIVFTKNATEALQPRRPLVGPRQPRRGRRRRAHPARAPRQHRAVADPRRRAAASRSAGSRSTTTATSTSPTSTSCSTAPSSSASPPCRTCSAPSPRCASSPTPPTPPAPCRVVDACQYVPHSATDVQATRRRLRRLLRPQDVRARPAIGVLWGREELLEAMPPFLGGGEMIRDVRLDGFTPNDLPWKFEAGTPPIAETIGLGAAVDYLDGARHGRRAGPRDRRSPPTPCAPSPSASATTSRSTARPTPPSAAASCRFAFGDLHPHDISQVLDEHAVCVRAGHHCAKPLMRVLGVGATARASVYVYNDESDIDALADALDAAGDFFAF